MPPTAAKAAKSPSPANSSSKKRKNKKKVTVRSAQATRLARIPAPVRYLTVALLLGCLGLVAAANWAVSRPLTATVDRNIYVSQGQGLFAIIDMLHAQGLVRQPQKLKLIYRLRGIPDNMQQGEYSITPGLRLSELIDNIATGSQIYYRIEVGLGETFADFHQKLLAHPQIVPTTRELSGAEIMALIGSEYEHPEGLFYADTYLFFAGVKDLVILQEAHKKLRDTLAARWAERSPQLNLGTPYQALILASIVEKETALARERPLIAGVFNNRLQLGMKLQTDPTVIYGLGERYDGNLRRRDLREATPYNTYRIDGLPPTPIAMVDERAINAVMQPETTDYIFFVAKHDGSGSHYFSANLEEHNAAVERYQLRKR